MAHWHEERVSRRAAALSYYTLLSLIPLLLITDAVLGDVFGHEAIRNEIDRQAGTLVGPEQAKALRALMTDVDAPSLDSWRTSISALLTFAAASGVFLELKDSLNGIWRVQRTGKLTLWRFLRAYFAPLTMVLGFGFLLLVSLVMSAFFSMLIATRGRNDPAEATIVAVTDQVTTVVLALLLFAAIFRFLADVQTRWRDVWLGALVTAAFFTIGRWLIGVYLGRADFSARYGSAGAVVALVVWVFYSAQILYTGAVFTRDRTLGSRGTVKAIRGASLESRPHHGHVGETTSKA